MIFCIKKIIPRENHIKHINFIEFIICRRFYFLASKNSKQKKFFVYNFYKINMIFLIFSRYDFLKNHNHITLELENHNNILLIYTKNILFLPSKISKLRNTLLYCFFFSDLKL